MAAVATLSAWLCASSVFAKPLVLRDVTVIPMSSDTTIAHCTLVIDKGFITSIAPFHAEEKFPDATVVECSDCYVMPGMVEMHAHLPYGHPTQPPISVYFKQCLAAGVT